MQRQAQWQDACFIVNAVPQELAQARQVIQSYSLQRTELFSAEDNFFQLPAVLCQCDLIISVETAVMHLANAVHVPVIASGGVHSIKDVEELCAVQDEGIEAVIAAVRSTKARSISAPRRNAQMN